MLKTRKKKRENICTSGIRMHGKEGNNMATNLPSHQLIDFWTKCESEGMMRYESVQESFFLKLYVRNSHKMHNA